jgi:hypothetical protein
MARVPPPCDLVLEPQLAPLLVLEMAAALTRNALRGQYIQIRGDHLRDETEEVIYARALARQCDLLRTMLRDYRRLVLDRLRLAQTEWPF